MTVPCQGPVAASAAATVFRPPVLPQAITSFGACVSAGYAWIYGGHIGREHAHSNANVVGSFQRLNLVDGGSWQALPPGPALQGTALVAAPDGALYRVGGLAAHNEPGEDADLHSTASVARFHPVRLVWEDATPLPEPRSSHDAVVLGDRLYVVGGWRLDGGEDAEWHDTAWVADLRQQPLVWQSLPPPPSPRRACALAVFGSRLVLLGGMGSTGPVATVHVFDPTSATWSDGPALPGFAFGTAAVAVGDRLHATVLDGRVLAWDGTASDWWTVGQLGTPRFFHRLLATDDGNLLALGGACRGGHMRTTERMVLGPSSDPVFDEFVLPSPSRVTHRQALFVHDEALWAVGGNRGLPGDRFASRQFADDIWRVDLLARTAVVAGRLPVAAQSLAVVRSSDVGDHVLAGGLGLPGDPAGATCADGARTLQQTWSWHARSRTFTSFAALPEPRTQTAMVAHAGVLYALGGTDFTPDADGGDTHGDMQLISTCDLQIEQPSFQRSELRMPRPRRSFAAAVVGDSMILLGGLGGGFEPAGPADVFHFPTRSWRELELPAPWVSPQAAVIGDRLYVACGGTMQGRHFTEDRSLWCWQAQVGWQRTVAELPFPVRHVQMLALRNRLLFYSAADGDGDRITIRTFAPDPSVLVLSPGFHP